MDYAEKIREEFSRLDKERDAGNKVPDNVTCYRNIRYGENPDWHLLDVYRPSGSAGKLPVVISFHGGGWVYGDKESYQWYTMSLAQRGFAVINFTYRLAPAFKFPAPLEDMNLVVSWMINHAAEFGFDTGNVFAVGDSAGANGLGLYTCILTNPSYAEKFDFQAPDNFYFRAIGLNCGCYHIDAGGCGQTSAMNLALMHEYLPEGGTADEMVMIDVAAHVTSGFPPVMVMTCDGDFLKDQYHYLVPVFTERNVPCVFRFCKGYRSELSHVFHLNVKSEEANRFNDFQCAFFKSYMR